jgi:hypothetical protein
LPAGTIARTPAQSEGSGMDEIEFTHVPTRNAQPDFPIARLYLH